MRDDRAHRGDVHVVLGEDGDEVVEVDGLAGDVLNLELGALELVLGPLGIHAPHEVQRERADLIVVQHGLHEFLVLLVLGVEALGGDGESLLAEGAVEHLLNLLEVEVAAAVDVLLLEEVRGDEGLHRETRALALQVNLLAHKLGEELGLDSEEFGGDDVADGLGGAEQDERGDDGVDEEHDVELGDDTAAGDVDVDAVHVEILESAVGLAILVERGVPLVNFGAVCDGLTAGFPLDFAAHLDDGVDIVRANLGGGRIVEHIVVVLDVDHDSGAGQPDGGVRTRAGAVALLGV